MVYTVTAVADRYTVLDARFILSAPDLETLGVADVPEIAFVGRSNVGKSSLLGAILGRPNLIKTSRTPGRTRTLNLFEVDVRVTSDDGSERHQALRFIDLPGYGYAKVSKKEKQLMSDMLSLYLSDRQGLSTAVQLIDIRHTPTADDREVYGGLSGQPYQNMVVVTKADKIPSDKRKRCIERITQTLGCTKPMTFSVPKKIGVPVFWERLFYSIDNASATQRENALL